MTITNQYLSCCLPLADKRYSQKRHCIPRYSSALITNQHPFNDKCCPHLQPADRQIYYLTPAKWVYPDGNFTPEFLEILSHNALHWIIFLWIVNSQWCLYNNHSIRIGRSTLSQKFLQADWSMLKNNEKATSNIYMPYQVPSQWSSLHLFYFVFAVEGQGRCHVHH